jgi:hypothetical protein
MAFGSAAFGQDASSQAAQIAARQEAAERDRLIRGELEELRQSFLQQQRRINELINENNALQRQLGEMDTRFRTAQANAMTRKDLEKVYADLKRVDEARQSDKNLILEQIKEVAKIAAKPAQVIVEPPVTRPTPAPRHTTPLDKDPDKGADETPVLDNPHGYFSYKIKSGDTLIAIMNAFNAKLKEQGKATVTLEQIKKANPKMNPNSMVVGREIQIPVPPDK